MAPWYKNGREVKQVWGQRAIGNKAKKWIIWWYKYLW